MRVPWLVLRIQFNWRNWRLWVRVSVCLSLVLAIMMAIRHLHRIPHFSPVGVGGNGWNPELLVPDMVRRRRPGTPRC